MDRTAPRVVSLDAYRGLVLLLLLPNPYSAWGVLHVARGHPDSEILRVLASWLTHVEWTGLSVWDMVLPSFLMLMGASIPLSNASRASRGEPAGWSLAHAGLRAVAFVVLGMLLSLRPATALEEAAPLLLLLGLALPLPERLARIRSITDSASVHRLRLAWSGLVLALGVLQLNASASNIGIHHMGNVLVQAGLAWLPVFLLARARVPVQWLLALGLLALWWLAFVLYPLPGPGTELARWVAQAGDERFTGWWAHWNKNTNFGAAIDTWFFESLPRSEPFALSPHGYLVSNFVPTIASIAFGVIAGQTIRSSATAAAARDQLIKHGSLLALAGGLAALTVCPLVKSIWTPSFALVSGGLAMLVLALLHHLCGADNRRWATPFVVLGANAILLYVLSDYPWRLLTPLRLVGGTLLQGPWAPLIESAYIALTLLIVAVVLHRKRIYIRI